MLLLQTVVAFIVMERHWQMVTTRLSAAVTRDIAAVIDLIDAAPAALPEAEVIAIARKRLGLTVTLTPGASLPERACPILCHP